MTSKLSKYMYWFQHKKKNEFSKTEQNFLMTQKTLELRLKDYIFKNYYFLVEVNFYSF